MEFDTYLRRWLRVFQRECHRLREWTIGSSPTASPSNSSSEPDIGGTSLAENAERRLTDLAHPALILRWRTLSESPALVRILVGHQDAVSSVAVSPDGRRIVSGSQDGTVVVWDLETGTPIHRLLAPSCVDSVAVGPDGRRIVSGPTSGRRGLGPETGTLIHRLTGHQAAVNSVAVSPDGRRIVSGSWTTRWRSGTSKPARSSAGSPGIKVRVNSVAVSPDGRRIVSGCFDETVAIWDLETGTLIHQLSGHQAAVNSVAVSPDGRRIVSGSEDNTVAVWDLKPARQSTGSPGFKRE